MIKTQWTKSDLFWIGIIIGIVFTIFILPPRIEEKIILQNEGNKRFDKYMYLDYALNNVANQEYILDVHDCTEFSKDLVKELDRYDIKAETIIIEDKSNDKYDHMIVGVWFEPQDGSLISSWDNYKRVR